MMQRGTVMKIDGKNLVISTIPLDFQCTATAKGGLCTCGAGGKAVEFRAYNGGGIDVKVGDFVEVNAATGLSVRGFLSLIVLPLVLALAFYQAAPLFLGTMSSALQAAVGLAGLLAGVGVRFLFPKATKAALPQLTHIVPLADLHCENMMPLSLAR